MSQIVVDTNLCTKDGLCVVVCPSKTLRINEKGFPEEIPDSGCILCGHCVAVCASEALVHNGLPQEPLTFAAKEVPSPAVIDGFLSSRRSAREFTDQPVAKETMEAILDVARRAPSACNYQKLHWIVVSGPEKVRALSAEILNGARALGASGAVAEALKLSEMGHDIVLRGAPTVVLACTPTDYDWGKVDSAIALTFLELAAESRGIGACWAGYLTRMGSVYPPLRKALSIPEGYSVRGALMLGKTKYKYRRVPPRKPLSVQWI
jgi:nitroreductase/NAD-dependent dihydropyrimidine dehydrogenase PreA subunit